MAGIRFPEVTPGHQGDSKDTTQQHKHCRANLRNKTELMKKLLLLMLLVQMRFVFFLYYMVL